MWEVWGCRDLSRSCECCLRWDGTFIQKTAGEWGGAAMIIDSNITGKTEMTFYHNSAGAVAVDFYVGYFSIF